MRKTWGIALLAFAAAAGAESLPPARPLPPTIDSRLDAVSARLNKLEEQSSSQGLLNLLNQVEALKNEVARLRGAQEEMAHRLQLADKRQKDVLADFDAQLKELRVLANRPMPVVAVVAPAPVDAAEPASVPPAAPDPEAETRAYETALNLFKAGDHAGAATAFNAFLDKYPTSPLAGNACYWLGLTYFATADHKNAVAAQQRLLKDYPQHAKVPDAMVNMARAQIQLGETESARLVLEQVIAKYPVTKSAELAKKILSLFK